MDNLIEFKRDFIYLENKIKYFKQVLKEFEEEGNSKFIEYLTEENKYEDKFIENRKYSDGLNKFLEVNNINCNSSRIEITKEIKNYILKNHLYNNITKEIKINNELEKLIINKKNKISLFELQSEIDHNFKY